MCGDIGQAADDGLAQGGAWRTLTGLAEFTAIYSYLTTAAKHGIDQIKALTTLFEGNCWLPPLAEV